MARREVSIDSTVKETVRAKLRLCVSRILLEGGMPAERARGSDADGASAGGVALCGVGVNDGTTRPARPPNLECSGATAPTPDPASSRASSTHLFPSRCESGFLVGDSVEYSLGPRS